MTATEIDQNRRNKKMAQIQALLDKADSTQAQFPEEADACRKKADDLMLAYSISEFEISRKGPQDKREKPELRRFDICRADSPVREQMIDLAAAVARHCRGKHVLYGTHLPNKGSMSDQHLQIGVVAFPSDLNFFEMLYTSLRLQMGAKLEPRPDPTLTEAENLAIMKESGMKWERIHALLHPGVPWERRHGVRYTKVYTDYCKANSRERIYTSPLAFARNYADGFVMEVNDRFQIIRRQQAAEQAATGSTGTDLVLRDMESEVFGAFKEYFPKTGIAKRSGSSKFDGAAHRRGRQAGAQADLGQTRMAGRKAIG